MGTQKLKNDLLLVRRKRGLSRKQVASLLGYKSTSTIGKIEQGRLIPRLETLLGLEILYRVPVAYLYPQLYASLRDDLRRREAPLLSHGAVDTPAAPEQEGGLDA
jgi:transcriptional regulator with XRE-family HTH domain